jgi:DNA-binding PadR family transcriptional regulator
MAQRPRHGYELHAAFETVMGGEENWDVKPAQIYSTLARLQESGHIVEEIDSSDDESADRRVYAITEKGQTDLAAWFNTPVSREHQRDEVFAKLMLAIATEVAQPRKVLQIQRRSTGTYALAARSKAIRVDLAHLLLDSGMHMPTCAGWTWSTPGSMRSSGNLCRNRSCGRAAARRRLFECGLLNVDC